MLGRLFLLFTIIPVLELWLLISIGGWLGPLPTLALVAATGLAGAALAKREGFRVLRSWQDASSKGELPKDGIIASVLVLVGGVLLITPGVVTDAVGLTLLIPGARRVIAKQIRGALERRFQLSAVNPAMFVAGMAARGPETGDGGEVIDVEAHDPTHAPDERDDKP
ncbi:MAG: FxsA family protein [Nannocystaceae bacterium]|nr:FxsA family protein [Nannocystaceae bacterium]